MTPATIWAAAWRTLVVVLPVLVAAAAAYLSGAAGQPRSWLWVPGGLALAAAGAAWLAWWGRPERRVAAVTLAVAAAALGVAVWVRSPPGTGVLARALEGLELPDRSQLVERSSGGNVLCFDVCTTVRHHYLVPGVPPGEVTARVRTALRDAGHTLEEPALAGSFSTTLDGSELHVAGRVEPAPEVAGAELWIRAVASG